MVALGDRAVLDTTRNDEELPRSNRDTAIAQLDRELALGDEEQLIGVLVGVPDELALDLDHLDLVVVESGHRLGRPVL